MTSRISGDHNTMTCQDDIAAHLGHYTLDEAIALIGDFLTELDERQRARLLELVRRGPRPLVAEALGLDDGEELLTRIHALHDDIANGVFVQDGVGYDPDYHAHRGWGDDSWIDEMDEQGATEGITSRVAPMGTTVGSTRWMSCSPLPIACS